MFVSGHSSEQGKAYYPTIAPGRLYRSWNVSPTSSLMHLRMRKHTTHKFIHSSNRMAYNVKLQGRVVGWAGYPREIDLASFSVSGDFDIGVLPWRREFDMVTILEDWKNLETSLCHRGQLPRSFCFSRPTMSEIKVSESVLFSFKYTQTKTSCRLRLQVHWLSLFFCFS